MLRRFRHWRKEHSQRQGRTEATGSGTDISSEIPEKNPTTPASNRSNRRRLRGTPSTSSPESPSSQPHHNEVAVVDSNKHDTNITTSNDNTPQELERRSSSPRNFFGSKKSRSYAASPVNVQSLNNASTTNQTKSSISAKHQHHFYHLQNPNAVNNVSPSSNHVKTTISNQDDEETEAWNRNTKEAANWDKQGTEHFEKGEYDQAFLCYEKALALKRHTLKPKDMGTSAEEASLVASVATSINNMTYLRQRSGKASSDETMAAYLQSLQMKREILGPDHLSVGKTLNNIGSVFYLQRDYEPALKAYLQAFTIMEKQLGMTHLDVGTVLSNIGDVYFAMKDREASKEHYRKALDVRWGALGPSDPKVVRLMEQLAFLETGRQPAKEHLDLSDSENEEYAMEDRLRHERFQEEVRVLHDELEEDMKFFDLLERKMAIDMIRDKTRMFRKMKEITDFSMAEVVEVSENTDHSETDPAIVIALPPIKPTTPAVPAKAENLEISGVDLIPDISTSKSENSSATSFLDRRKSLMTPEERKEALKNVRNRLASLRAGRQTHNDHLPNTPSLVN
jgi:tetratricopeptide (TPR) repeat protein